MTFEKKKINLKDGRVCILRSVEVKDAEGNTVTCADLTKDGKKILMWLEESREPTEHILNEILEHA